MELILNLAWLSIALGAVLHWKQQSNRPGCSRLKSLLALACLLALLFPVVSASDDLHPLRAEAEESTKRLVNQALLAKSPVHAHAAGPPALPVVACRFSPGNEVHGLPAAFLIPRLEEVQVALSGSRAPPLA